MDSGTALDLKKGTAQGEEDALTLRYACEAGMEGLCFAEGVGRVKAVRYKAEGGILSAGICLSPAATGLPACGTDGLPVLGRALEEEVEAFRVAYRPRGRLDPGRPDDFHELRRPAGQGGGGGGLLPAAGQGDGGPGLHPGAGLAFPDGLSLSTFGLSSAALSDGRPRAERLVVALTPNLSK